MHLKTDYEADSSLRNWGIKHNDERITVFVTIKKLANLHSEQFVDDLQGSRIQNATRNEGVVESYVAAEFAPQAAFVFLFRDRYTSAQRHHSSDQHRTARTISTS